MKAFLLGMLCGAGIIVACIIIRLAIEDWEDRQADSPYFYEDYE